MTGRVTDQAEANRGLPPRQGLRVLLVEDHRDSAEAIATVLRLWGHELQLAGTVGEALAFAAEAERLGPEFDLALCDIGLPDGSGWDLMRQLVDRYGLPGIAVTALSSPLDRDRSAAAGFARHLVKPLDLDELEAALALLGHRDGGDRGEAGKSAPDG